MRKLLAAAIVALGFSCGASEAATLTLTGTPTGIYASFYSSFSVTFDDTGNNLLDPGEVTAFSGITSFGLFYNQLTQIGTVPGYTNVASAQPWGFYSSTWGSLHLNVDDFTYGWGSGSSGGGGSCTSSCGSGGSHSGVPEPTVWALMIAGFAGLGFSLRRRVLAS